MGKPGLKNILLGIIIMFAGYFLKDMFASWGAAFLYYLVEVIGLIIVGLGFMEFFREGRKSDEDRQAELKNLTKEVLLKTLARTCYADTNTKDVEVKTVQKIYEEVTGEKVTAAQVRVAARGDLTEDKAFRKYLREVQSKISDKDKQVIVRGLSDVIKADENVSPGEVDFFNEVVDALKLKPTDVANLR